MEILAIIPARSGSKSVQDKNIRSIGGRPLLSWSIDHARESNSVTRTIVSTDSERYAEIARHYGAETPFLRPAGISGDQATDLGVFTHALDWLQEHEGYEPDICVHLRPTCPVRREGLVDEAVAILREDPSVDSVRTVGPTPHTPYKMWTRNSDGTLEPLLSHGSIKEPWNIARQDLPETLLQTANVDVVRSSVIKEKHSMTGGRIFGLEDPTLFDIDDEHDFLRAHAALAAQLIDVKPRTFCFDIDGVIAQITEDLDYAKAGPREDMIACVNRLHEAGHHIVLCTARGYVTGKDWATVTENQMKQWGVRYHELKFGKPAADYYIDDRMLSMHDVMQLGKDS